MTKQQGTEGIAVTNTVPLFKYAGGKERMLELYRPFFANLENKNCFVDYFGGTGTMSIWVKSLYPHMKILLNELNSEIFGIYDALKNSYGEFLLHAQKLDAEYTAIRERGIAQGLSMNLISKPRDKQVITTETGQIEREVKGENYERYYPTSREAFYYDLRSRYADAPETFSSSVEKSATLYFMLQTNFSGIWQTRSKDGVYYTPFGLGTEKNSRLNLASLFRFHEMLQDATISNQDFRSVEASRGSIHYFDPPYIDSHTKYQKGGFSAEATKDLCERINTLYNLGECVFFSNKDGDYLRETLSSLKFVLFPTQYTAGRKNSEEGSRAVEILFHNNKKTALHIGITEKEYKEIITLLDENYFVGKIIPYGYSDCWFWDGCYQIKKTLENRAHPVKPLPHAVLWCIINKRLLQRSSRLERVCHSVECCNPRHWRLVGDVKELKMLVNKRKFDLTVTSDCGTFNLVPHLNPSVD